MEKLQQAILSQYMFQGGLIYICGIVQNTQQSGRAIATVLLSVYSCFR